MRSYINKLEIVDENNTILFRLNKCKAQEALNSAMLFLAQKEGITKKEIKKSYWNELDKEFKEYFEL